MVLLFFYYPKNFHSQRIQNGTDASLKILFKCRFRKQITTTIASVHFALITAIININFLIASKLTTVRSSQWMHLSIENGWQLPVDVPFVPYILCKNILFKVIKFYIIFVLYIRTNHPSVLCKQPGTVIFDELISESFENNRFVFIF